MSKSKRKSPGTHIKSRHPDVRAVEWIDSCTTFGWRGPDPDGVTRIQSVGILVKQNKREVTLTTSKSMNTGNVLDQISIPRCAIRSIRKVKV